MRGGSSRLPVTSPISSRLALGTIGPLSAPRRLHGAPDFFDDGSGKRGSSPSFSRLREGVLTEGRLGQGLLLALDSCQKEGVGAKTRRERHVRADSSIVPFGKGHSSDSCWVRAQHPLACGGFSAL